MIDISKDDSVDPAVRDYLVKCHLDFVINIGEGRDNSEDNLHLDEIPDGISDRDRQRLHEIAKMKGRDISHEFNFVRRNYISQAKMFLLMDEIPEARKYARDSERVLIDGIRTGKLVDGIFENDECPICHAPRSEWEFEGVTRAVSDGDKNDYGEAIRIMTCGPCCLKIPDTETDVESSINIGTLDAGTLDVTPEMKKAQRSMIRAMAEADGHHEDPDNPGWCICGESRWNWDDE